MGRKSKLTTDVQDKIVQALRAGNYFETACEYAGVSPSTAYEWIQRGEGRHPKRRRTKVYAEFAEAVKKAAANAEVKNVAVIQQATNDSWRAAAWWLQRRFPSRWGRQENRIDVPDELLLLLPDLVMEIRARGWNPVEVVASMIDKMRRGRQIEG